MPEPTRPAPRFFAPPGPGRFFSLAGLALCAVLFFLDARQPLGEIDADAARVFALALALSPATPGIGKEARLAAFCEAVAHTPPFIASRLVADDASVSVFGRAAVFDERPGLSGFLSPRYATRIALPDGRTFRLEILADATPATFSLLGRLALFALLGACLLRLSAIARAKPAFGGDPARPANAPDEPATRSGQDAPPAIEDDAASREILAVMPLRLRSLAPLFMKTTFDNARRMRAALERGDLEEARRLGHSLKGSARSYGLPELGDRGLALERAAADKDAERAAGLLDELDDALSRMRIVFEERAESKG